MIAALGLGLTLSGCFGDDLPTVQTEPVGSGRVTQTVSAPARVDAAAQQDVAAAVSGTVVALEVADGDPVQAGQTVVRLESTQVDLARQQAAAARSAAADTGDIRIRDGSAATLASTRDAVSRLDAAVLPRLAEARARAAAVADSQQRAAADASIDALQATYLSTRAALVASGQAVAAQQQAAAGALTDALEQAVRQATAPQRLQADAAAAAAAAQAEHLVVTAPFGGIVELGDAGSAGGLGALPAAAAAATPTDLSALAGQAGALADPEEGGSLRVGAPVAVGQTLFTVYDLSSLYVTADVDEVDAPQVQPGQRATVAVDAFPDVEFEGVVEEVRVSAATTQAGGVGYPTRIRILGPAGGSPADPSALRVGMTASAEIATKTATSDRVVPSRALLRRDGATVVYVVRDGTVSALPVQVVALGEDTAAVAGDLGDGEQVVVSGYEDVTEGDRVRTR